MSQRSFGSRSTIARILAAGLLLAASACKKDEPKKAVALSRIDVAPSVASVAVGLTTTFTATGVYSDGTTQDLTSQVLWTVEDGVAFFPTGAAPGTAHGLQAGGPAVVRAIQLGTSVSGEAALTVTGAVPVSVDVSPALVTLAAGLTQPLIATAVLSDGSHADVTSQVAWSSSAPLVASVSTIPATAGTVSALAVGGPVTITATLAGPGVAGTATVNVAAAAVAAIDVAPASATVAAGRTQPFTADAVLTDGTRVAAAENATWSSADPGIASVSNAAGTRGLVTGLRAGGPVTLTVRLPGVAAVGVASVSVSPAELVSIAVAPAELWLAAGTGTVLRAAGTFSDGTRADLTGAVTWSSSEPARVSVGNGAGGAGVVSAILAGGPVTITAALPSGGPTASATVNVTPAALVALEVAPATASEPLGRARQFAATGVFSNGTRQDLTTQVSWLSSDPAVATVSNALASAGLAQSRGEGEAEIIAWFPGSSTTASATFTVTPPELVSLALTPATASIPAGRTQRYTALGTFTDAVVRDVTATAAWSSTLPGVAAPTGLPGEFRGAAPGGPATLTAIASGIPATALLTVGPPVLEAIALTPPSLALRWGEAATLTARGTWSDATQRDVTAEAAWSASPGGIVRLDPVAGALRITGRGLGATVVTAALDGVEATASVVVDPLFPDRIDVVPGTGLAQTGTSLGFRAFATYPGGAVVDVSADALWTSGDPTVALASMPPGTFEALTAGVTTVTATLGVSGSASVEVTDSPPVRALAALRIDGNEPPLSVGGVAQLRALATWNDGVEEDLSAIVAWTSTDDGVVSVDAAGVAEALAVGSVTVTALHAPSSLAAQAGVVVLPDRPVDALVVRAPDRIVEGQPVPVAAIGLLAGGGEVDLTLAVQWVPVAAGTQVGGGVLRGSVPRAEVAAIYGGLVATAEAVVVPLDSASRYEIVPGDATLAPAPPTPENVRLFPFVSVLTFDDAWPREVVAGDCTDEQDLFLECAIQAGWFDGMFGEVPPGCEIICVGGPGVSACLPLAPATRTIECRAGALLAQASVTVSDTPPAPTLAGLFIRPTGWAASNEIRIDPFNWELNFDFRAPLPPRLHPGEQAGLEAVAVFSDATLAAVAAAWSSTAPPIAWVEPSGVVHGRAPGAAAIQAAAQARTAFLELDVYPPMLGTGLQIDGPAQLLAGTPGSFQAWRVTGGGFEETWTPATAAVLWSSSNPAVASFDPAVPGRLLAHGTGDAIVTARSRDGFTAQRPVRVIGVESLLVTPVNAIAVLGERSVWFDAWARMSDGSVQRVSDEATWTIDDPSVAMPESDPANGAYWPLDFGFATVTAEYAGRQASASLEVAGDAGLPAVDSLVIQGVPAVAVGGTVRPEVVCIQRNSEYCPVDASFGWTTANPAIAEPAAGDPGAIAGVSAGATTFTVTDPTGTVSATGAITVYALTSLEVSPMVAAVGIGDSVEFTVTAIDTAGGRHPIDAATWSSSNPAVADFTEPSLGLATALAAGSTTVTATALGLQGTSAVTVGPARLVGFQVTPGSLPLVVGTQVALRATAWFGDGTSRDVTGEATWSSLDEAVVAPVVSGGAGAFEGIALGSTAVVATWSGAGSPQSAVAAIRVKPPITQILVFFEMDWIPAGLETFAQAGAMYADGSIEEITAFVTWSVDDPAVAEVVAQQPGMIRALAEGMVRVTATDASGPSGWADLRVLPPIPLMIGVTPADAIGVGGQPSTFTASAIFSDGTSRDVTAEASWETWGMADVLGQGVIVPRMSGEIQVGAFMYTEGGEAAGYAVLHVPPFLVEVLVEPAIGSYFEGDVASYIASGRHDTGEWIDVTGTATWSADRAEAVATGIPGQFRFDGRGSFTLSAAAAPGGPSGSANAWVEPGLLSVTLTPPAISIDVGQWGYFSAEAQLTDGSVRDVTLDATWSLEDPAIALNYGGGAFVSTGWGATEVVATWSLGTTPREARGTLTVAPVPVGMRLEPPPTPLRYGEEGQFTVWIDMSDGVAIDVTSTSTWWFDRGDVVATAIPGRFRFDGTGSFMVRATTADGLWSKQVWIEVVAVPVSLTVTPNPVTIDQGAYASFVANVGFSDGTVEDLSWMVSWSSVDPSVAAWIGSSEFVGQSVGVTEVVATYSLWGETVEGRAALTVVPFVTGYTFSPSAASIRFDQSVAFTFTQHLSDGSSRDYTGDATWTVGDPAVLAGAGPGQFTPVGAGLTLVYATSTLGLQWTTVEVRPFQGLVVTPANATVPFNGTIVPFTVMADDQGAPWDVTSLATWGSSDPGVALFGMGAPNEATTGVVGVTIITAYLPDGSSAWTALTVE